jgi:hypothetical protein
MDLRAGFFSLPSLSEEAATEQALRGLAGASQLGTTVVDQSVLALVPDLCRAGEYTSWAANNHLDSILYFAGGFENDLARKTSVEAGLDRVYEVSGTQIRLATNRPIEEFRGLAPLRSPM